MGMKKFDRKPGVIMELWGPVADPSPEFIPWWEQFSKEQQRAILVKEIDMKIRNVEFNIESLKLELERLGNIKSMIKG